MRDAVATYVHLHEQASNNPHCLEFRDDFNLTQLQRCSIDRDAELGGQWYGVGFDRNEGELHDTGHE